MGGKISYGFFLEAHLGFLEDPTLDVSEVSRCALCELCCHADCSRLNPAALWEHFVFYFKIKIYKRQPNSRTSN